MTRRHTTRASSGHPLTSALTLALLTLATAHCAGEATPQAGGRIAIEVAPLDLPGLTEARYTVTVTNSDDAVVWSRALSSTSFGDGAGSLSYLGPCDADASPNTVSVVLDALESGEGPLVAGVDYANPAPSHAPLRIARPCLADSDTSVTFDLTIARAAKQGFFDVAVTFDDIFCSAKLDCQKETDGVTQNLTLLTNADGVRDLTAVLGFACTAGHATDTNLYMDNVIVRCGQDTYQVDVSAGPGQLDPPFTDPSQDLLFQTAIYRGSEQLGDYRKGYWNVALGLNDQAFAYQGGCVLEANATASNGPLTADTTPTGGQYPYVTWSVPLTNAAGMICTRHPLNNPAGDNGVTIAYTGTNPISFDARYDVPSQSAGAQWGPLAPVGWLPIAEFVGSDPQDGTLYDGIGTNTEWADEESPARMRQGAVLAHNFKGDFDIIASWGHNYPTLGAVYGPDVDYNDLDGTHGVNWWMWAYVDTTGFPSGYVGTIADYNANPGLYTGAFLGYYYYSEKSAAGDANGIWYNRWTRVGTQLSVQYSQTGADGTWVHIPDSPQTIGEHDAVVIGVGDGDYTETERLKLVSFTAETWVTNP